MIVTCVSWLRQAIHSTHARTHTHPPSPAPALSPSLSFPLSLPLPLYLSLSISPSRSPSLPPPPFSLSLHVPERVSHTCCVRMRKFCVCAQAQALEFIGVKIKPTKFGRRTSYNKVDEAREKLATVVVSHVPVVRYDFRPKAIYIALMVRRIIQVCMCVCVCMHACTRTRAQTHTHTAVHARGPCTTYIPCKTYAGNARRVGGGRQGLLR